MKATFVAWSLSLLSSTHQFGSGRVDRLLKATPFLGGVGILTHNVVKVSPDTFPHPILEQEAKTH